MTLLERVIRNHRCRSTHHFIAFDALSLIGGDDGEAWNVQFANGNAATIAALRTDLTSRDATIVALQADLAARDASITALTAELATFRTQAADLQSAVTALESQRVDVQTEVIHQLAAAGVTQEALPQGTTSTEGQQTPEELWSAAEATDDPKEKGRLAAKAMQASAKVRATREKAALN